MAYQKTNKAAGKSTARRLGVSTMVNYTDRDGQEKTQWTNVGSAFQGDKGISVILNSLPINGKLFISEIPTQTEMK